MPASAHPGWLTRPALAGLLASALSVPALAGCHLSHERIDIRLMDGATPDAPPLPLDAGADGGPPDAYLSEIGRCPSPPRLDRCDGGGDYGIVMVVADFARSSVGRTRGFDLDGRASEAGDPETCGHADTTGTETGVPAVDNQLGLFASEIEGALGRDGVVGDAIHSGDWLTLIELRHVDSEVEDDCVDVIVCDAVLAEPELRFEGVSLAPDTLVIGVPGTSRRFEHGGLARGFVEASGGRMPMAWRLEEGLVRFDLADARLRGAVVFMDDGVGGSGWYAGGSVAVSVVQDALRGASAPSGSIGLMAELADLERDDSGTCRAVSGVLRFSGGAVRRLR